MTNTNPTTYALREIHTHYILFIYRPTLHPAHILCQLAM